MGGVSIWHWLVALGALVPVIWHLAWNVKIRRTTSKLPEITAARIAAIVAAAIISHSAHAQSPANVIDGLSQTICFDNKGDYIRTAMFLEHRYGYKKLELYKDDTSDGLFVKDREFTIRISNLKNGSMLCSASTKSVTDADFVINQYKITAGKALISSNDGNGGEFYLLPLLKLPDGRFLSKILVVNRRSDASLFSVGIVNSASYMMGRAQEPQDSSFMPNTGSRSGSGSLLDDVRKRQAATLQMECLIDGKSVTVQVVNGAATLGIFGVDALEVDGQEIAFKFFGIVHTFDFKKRTGRRFLAGDGDVFVCY